MLFSTCHRYIAVLVRTIIEYQYKIALLADVTKTVAVINVWLCCKGT